VWHTFISVVTKLQERAARRPLERKIIGISTLHLKGVYVTGVPDAPHLNDFAELYFKNKKFGGSDDCVESVKLGKISGQNLMIVFIKTHEGINVILL